MNDPSAVVLPENAPVERVTMELWKDIRGGLHVHESSARRESATHTRCEQCSAVIPMRSFCSACSDRRQLARFEAMERRPWDGKAPLYSEERDEYYFGAPDEIDTFDYDRDTDVPLSDLRLVICEPVYARALDSDNWVDDLPGDEYGDSSPPAWLESAITEFNAKLKGREPLSWMPGKFALDCTPYEVTE